MESGAGTAASIDGDIREAQPAAGGGSGGGMPEPPADEGTEARADAGAPPASMAPESDGSEPDSSDNVYFACTNSRLLGCDYIYITAVDPERELCVQMTLDSCERYGDGPLQVDVPLSWRFASASVLVSGDECAAGEFYAASSSVIAATGSIDWNVDSQQPTDLVIDVTLEPSQTGTSGVPERLTIATRDLAGPLPECDG